MRRQCLQVLCLVVAACLLAAPAAATDKKCTTKWLQHEPRTVHVVNTPNVNVVNMPTVSVPDGVAIINAPDVNVANTPGVLVVNDEAYPIPVVVQNPQGGSQGLSEVTVTNGAGQPVPVCQASTYHTVYLQGNIPSASTNWSVFLNWPADKAFLVKTVALWSETRVSVLFPVWSAAGMTTNDYIWMCATDGPGGTRVENLQGGILLRETGVTCRIDKLDPDFAQRQFRLLVTGELVPK